MTNSRLPQPSDNLKGGSYNPVQPRAKDERLIPSDNLKRWMIENLSGEQIDALTTLINNEKIALLTEVYVPIGENDSNALLDQKALRTHIKVFQKLATLKKGESNE